MNISSVQEPEDLAAAEADHLPSFYDRAAARLRSPWLIATFWLGAAVALLILFQGGPGGWDAKVCYRALRALQSGTDPYAANLAVIQQFRDQLPAATAVRPPILYVYSLLTLPLLRVLTGLSGVTLAIVYFIGIATGIALQLWAGFQLASRSERRWLVSLLPLVLFFPGFITDDVILSGNVAFLLYGLMLAAAVPGWKRGKWRWYYVAVLFASIFKLPYLSMVALPVLLSRRQWIAACGTTLLGVSLFAAQFWLWPQMTHDYVLGIRFMFDVGHDFGYGFAGEFNQLLWRIGVRSWASDLLIYLAFAAPFGILLLYLARRVRRGHISEEKWVPLALLGTAMLNPRIMNYDLFPITIPMVLLAVRAMRTTASGSLWPPTRMNRRILFLVLLFFVTVNLITIAGPQWIPVELTTLCVVFAAGAWQLREPAADDIPERVAIPEEVETC